MFTINIMKLFVSMTSANVHRFMFIVPDIIKKNGQLICNLYMSHIDHTGMQPGAVLAVDYFSQVHSRVILSTHKIRYQKKIM